MSTMQVTLFGAPQLAVDGTPVDIARDRSLALMIYLAMTKAPHRRDRLAGLLWPDTDQSIARAYLRHALYVLKQHLGDVWFEADRRQIMLRPNADVRVDVHEFRRHRKTTRDAGDESVSDLAQAAELAHDEFLAGFSLPDAPEFDEWQLFEREQLRRELADVLESLVAHHEAEQNYRKAISYGVRWLALDPLEEAAHRTLMRLYALSGETPAALRQYTECMRILRKELDVSPSDDTSDLYDAILCAEVSGAAGRALTAPTGANLCVPHNLPNQPTPFVGREAELATLERLLADPDVRLISIVGPGGMGKTRLALACAERQLQRPSYPHGVYFVNLAPLTDPGHLALAIANAVGFVPKTSAGRSRAMSQQVVDHLRARQILLLLDNFEHLLDGTGLINDLLQSTSSVRILVTSREQLRMRAEHVLRLQGLEYARSEGEACAADYPAVRLFDLCARRTAPDFTLAGDSLDQAIEICRLVEGMPLGIELAAAWASLLTLSDIVQEIRCSLTFLEANLRDAAPRHHSIRAVFDSTWERLDATERRVFAALSVFRGGFTREAASVVAGATLDQLSNLTSKSLIQLIPQAQGLAGRYGIHELLRQYGAIMLAEAPVVVRRARAQHNAYYVDFLHARLDAINGPHQRQAADDIAAELDNVRAAWQWAVDQADVKAIHRAATTFFLFCQMRSYFLAGADAFASAAASLEGVPPSPLRDLTLAQLLDHEGWLRIRVGDFDLANSLLEKSRALYAQPHVSPPPPYMGTDPVPALAIVAQIRGDYSRALALGEEALAAASERQDQLNQSYAHYGLTSACAAVGNYSEATAHARQACELAQALGNRWFLAILLNEWGKVARALGDLAQAKRHFQASYEIKREFDDPEGMAVALNHMGEIALLQNEITRAEYLYREALTIYQGISDRVGLGTAQRGLAQIASARKDDAAACRWFGLALDIGTETHYLPLLLAVFVDASDLLLRHGSMVGIEALASVEQHPATDHETHARASFALTRWRSRMDPDLYDAAWQRAEAGDLEAIVAAVKVQLALSANDAT